MSIPASPPALRLTRAASLAAPRVGLLVLAAAVALVAALLAEERVQALILASVAGTLAALAILLRLLDRAGARRARELPAQAAAVLEHDPAPCFVTDAEGAVCMQNPAATERFGTLPPGGAAQALAGLFANPAAVLHRLRLRAAIEGAAREDLVTRAGHKRLSVHRLGEAGYLWRLDDLTERAGPAGRPADALPLPMLTASRSGTVLYMNDALRTLVGSRPKSLDRLFLRLPVRGGEEVEIATASGRRRVLLAEVEGACGRRELYFLPPAAHPPPPASEEEGALFEELPVALLRLDPGGAILAANRLARELLALTPGEGRMLAEVVEGLGRSVRDWLADAMAGRLTAKPEVLRAALRSDEVYVQVTLRRLPEGGGRSGLMAVLIDATELKTLEAQFVQSQKMQAIGQLAGGVAHDFNNLLTAISGHCDLLLLRHDQGDPDYADLVQIHQTANRAASLVGQLLAFSRKQTLQPEVLDLRETLSDLTHLLSRLVGERVTLTFAHDPGLRPIRADRRQLEQVIMNLVVNARDAMPDGGEIRIETESLHLAEELHRDRAVVPPGDYAVVRVRDEGVGIPPERLPKIFEPFFTTKRAGEGTGLGLSTAYGIVKQSGGFIFADSEPGQGAVFSLFFPIHDGPPEPAAEATARPSLPPAVPGEGIVLLVEDEAPVRAFAARALRLRGYQVLEADSAEAALEILDDLSVQVDILVTDVVMPGMDGPSFVREAMRGRPGLRVVFVSGYAQESLADILERVPNAAFLAKPFSLGDLTATVSRQLH